MKRINNLSNKLDQLNQLVKKFDYETAHDQFYHKDLVKHENEDVPTIGLENHRKEMEVFLSKIRNNEAVLLNTIVSDDMTITNWHYKFEHEEWGKKDFKEVSIQRWNEGKIIHERHIYKTDNW